jgi:glucose-6-phosphate 1-dehydrogenase
MNKTPTLTQGGYELQPSRSTSRCSTPSRARSAVRIAYERLLLEAISDNSTLFVRRDEAEAAWVWIDRIIEGWARTGIKPAPYQSGSWGPAGAFALTERNGHSWYE